MAGENIVNPNMVMRKHKKVTPALIIFKRHYPIQISGLHLIDEKSLELFGFVTTGDRQQDMAIASSVRTAAATIAGMAVMLEEGANFTVESPEVANEIFSVIQEHLLAWSRVIDQSFNTSDAPIEGLKQLERVAEYLYPYAMRARNATQVESHLYRSIRQIVSQRSGIRRFENDKPSKKIDQPITPYHSVTEDLTKHLSKRTLPWS